MTTQSTPANTTAAIVPSNSQEAPKKEKSNAASLAASGVVGAAAGAAGALALDAIQKDNAEHSQSEHHHAANSQTGNNHAEQPVAQAHPANQAQPVDQQPIDENVTETPEYAQNEIDENPDEVVETLIAEEEVDPTDIDLPTGIIYDELGVVYTESGEEFTAAAFHDEAGEQYYMIDVDGDNTFDVVTDTQGNTLGGLADAITVDDVEFELTDADTYMAQDDTDTPDDYGVNTIEQDLIS